jgi:hypothetical protein
MPARQAVYIARRIAVAHRRDDQGVSPDIAQRWLHTREAAGSIHLPRLVLSPRTTRLIQVFVAGLLVCWVAYVSWVLSRGLALDYGVYRDVGQRVLAGGPLYAPEQLAGPHVVVLGDSMYPPSSLPLFLVFALIPQPFSLIAWYVIPLSVIGTALWRLRPTGWRLIAILGLLAYPPSIAVVWLGNPALWAVAGLSAGLLYRWPAAFVLLKPSLAPFVLVGIRDRRWWLATGVFAVLTLAMMPLTVEWVRVLLNARGEFSGIGYSIGNVPIFLLPLVAGMNRSPERGASRDALPPGATRTAANNGGFVLHQRGG